MLISNVDLALGWDQVEVALCKAFEGAEFVNEEYSQKRILEVVHASIYKPDIVHMLACTPDPEGPYQVIGGIMGLPSFSPPNKERVTGIGWMFVDPDLPPRARLDVTRRMREDMRTHLFGFDYQRLEVTIGTKAGENALSRFFDLKYEPSPEDPHRWVGDLT